MFPVLRKQAMTFRTLRRRRLSGSCSNELTAATTSSCLPRGEPSHRTCRIFERTFASGSFTISSRRSQRCSTLLLKWQGQASRTARLRIFGFGSNVSCSHSFVCKRLNRLYPLHIQSLHRKICGPKKTVSCRISGAGDSARQGTPGAT